MMRIKRIGTRKARSTKCQRCGAGVHLKKIDEHHLDTIGLPNVWLLNIDGYDCAACGNHSILIPEYGILMHVVCEILVFKNTSHTSQELRFLLKYFDVKGKELAKRLGTSEKTVSFWLNGRATMSPSYGMKFRKLISALFCDYVNN